MPSDARKPIEVSPEFYDWCQEFARRVIVNADKLAARGVPSDSQKEYLLYKKVLRAMEANNDKVLRLARKEAKILWREANNVIDYLTEKVLPEYDRRIAADPKTETKYRPYIEKTRKVKAMLVLGVAELRRLL